MERLGEIEDLLKQVERQQEDLKGLEPLLGSVDSVLHFDSLFSQYRKRLADLSLKSTQVADYVSSLRAQSSFHVTSTATLQALANRRDAETKALETKVSTIEELYQQIETEGKACEQRVGEKILKAREGAIRRFEKELEVETERVKVALNTEKATVRTELEQAKVLLKSTVLPSQQSRGTSLIQDLHDIIEVRTRGIAKGLEDQYSSLQTHIDSTLLSACIRVCTLRSSLTLTPSLHNRGLHLLNCLRLHLDSLSPLMQRAKACSLHLADLSNRVTTLKSTNASEAAKAVIAEEIASVSGTLTALTAEVESTSEELEDCFDLVTGLETAVQREVPQERVQLMTSLRTEVSFTQYKAKKERTLAVVQRAQRDTQTLLEVWTSS